MTPGARIIVTLFALTLPFGCGSAPNSSSGTVDSNFVASRVLTRAYQGTVYLSQPADQVEVQLLPLDSDVVLARFQTNGAGIFELPEDLPVPGQFRLSVLAPEGIRVERFVGQGELPYLWINIPSHLISLYRRRHPQFDESTSEAFLRENLSLGGLYGTSDGPNSSFSHRRFLQAVQKSGLTFQAYCEKVVNDLESGQAYDFGSPTRLFEPKEETRPKLIGFLADEVGTKLFDSAVEFTVGKISAASGLHIGTQGDFQQIDAKLDAISEQLTSLTNLVTTGFLNGIVFADQALVQGIVDNLGVAQTGLKTLSQATAASYASDPNVFDHGPASIPASTTNLIQSFDFVVTSKALEVFQRVLTSSSTQQNLLLLAGKQASLQLKADPNPAFNDYPLRKDSLTAQLESNFDLYVGYCSQLSTLFSETANASYLPQTTLGFLPPANSLNGALASIVQVSSMLRQAQQLVPQSVGSDLVLIDSENGLMWYLQAQLCKYNVAQNGMIGLKVNNWALPPGIAPPEAVGSKPSEPNQSKGGFKYFKRDPNMAGWRVPEISELRTLYQRVVALGGGNRNPPNTLVALKALGFRGLPEDSSENYKKYWYNGSVDGKFTEYDISKDDTGSEANSLGNNPNYTCIYVRTLSNRSLPFGDTGNQFHKGYGLGLYNLALTEIPANPANPTVDRRTLYLQGKLEAANVAHAPGIPGIVPSDLGDRAVWTLENLSPPDCAFLNFSKTTASQPDSNGYLVAAGTNTAQLIFRGPGTATVRATVTSPQASVSGTDSQTFTSNLRPVLQSISISPQNLAFQTRPGFQQFYCTGYLPTGETVDLTNLVTWSILTPPPASYSGSNPTRIDQGPPTGGDLIFGDQGSISSNSDVVVQARYTAGSNPGASWSDGGQTITDTATFHVP